jgi:hypothetical protein
MGTPPGAMPVVMRWPGPRGVTASLPGKGGGGIYTGWSWLARHSRTPKALPTLSLTIPCGWRGDHQAGRPRTDHQLWQGLTCRLEDPVWPRLLLGDETDVPWKHRGPLENSRTARMFSARGVPPRLQPCAAPHRSLAASDREVEVGVAAESEGEGLLRRAVPGEAGGIVAGNSGPDPVAGRDDGGDGQ